jgi:hypothetical protein
MLFVTGFVTPIWGEQRAKTQSITQNETSSPTLIPAH